MVIGAPPQCWYCKHYFTYEDKDGFFCHAYPDGDGIPEPIQNGNHDHTKAYKGDKGIRFEPDGGTPQP